MATDDLDELIARMDAMAIAVNGFKSEAVQLQAFSALISAFGIRPDDSGSSSSEGKEDVLAVEASTKKPKRQIRKTRTSDVESPTGLDAIEVVNAIKSHEKFDAFYSKIIVGDASRANKVKFVSWFADKELTSGDMQRVLNALGVKMDAPTASKAVADVQHEYLKNKSGRVTLFKLSAKARAEYENWLLSSADN